MSRTQSIPVNGAAQHAMPPQRKTRGAKSVEQTLPPVAKPWHERWAESVADGLSEFEAPSWVRVMVSTFIGMAAYAATWVGAVVLVDKLVIAAALYAGAVGFLSTFTYVLGILLAFLISVGTGLAAFRFCENFHFDSVAQRVGGWFRRSEKLTVRAKYA